MPSTIKVKRGLEANRTSITPAAGEFLYTTDQKKVYIGDGTTAGGNLVAANQLELIATANASGASSVQFTNLSSDYAEYQLICSGLYASGLISPTIRTSSNNGTSWDAGASDYNYRQIREAGTTITGSSTTAAQIVLQEISNNTFGNYLFCKIVNAGVARQAVIDAVIGCSGTGTSRIVGYRLSTTAINAIQLSGSTLTGTFKLYGVKA